MVSKLQICSGWLVSLAMLAQTFCPQVACGCQLSVVAPQISANHCCPPNSEDSPSTAACASCNRRAEPQSPSAGIGLKSASANCCHCQLSIPSIPSPVPDALSAGKTDGGQEFSSGCPSAVIGGRLPLSRQRQKSSPISGQQPPPRAPHFFQTVFCVWRI